MRWSTPLLFSSLGVAMEVVFTALSDAPRKRDVKLTGYSYLWMLPVYASVPYILSALKPRLDKTHPATKLTAYIGAVYAAEFATGAALCRAFGECPWEANYRGKRWAMKGWIRLDYWPTWALAALVFERVFVELESPRLQAEVERFASPEQRRSPMVGSSVTHGYDEVA